MKKAIFLFDYTGIMALPWAKAGYICYCFDGQHPVGVSISSLHPNIINIGMWFDNEIRNEACRHNVRAVLDITGDDVDFIFGFPECTDLAVSGAAHFAKKKSKDPEFQDKAMILVYLTMHVGQAIDKPWAFENPVSVISTKFGKPNFKFHPHEYGGYLPEDDKHPLYPEYIKPRDAYPKKTCIWASDDFIMPDKKEVGPDCSRLIDGKFRFKNQLLTKTRQKTDPTGSPMFDVNGAIMEEYQTLKYSQYDIDGYPIWGYSIQHKKLGGKSLKTKNIRSATPRGFAQAVFEANHEPLQ